MFRSVHIAILLLLLAAPAAAEELQFELGSTTAWESDIRRGAVGGGDDVVWEIRPRVRLEGTHPRLDYSLGYDMRAEFYTQLSELDEQNHYFTGSADYHLGRRTSLGFRNRLSMVSNIRRLNDLALTGEEGEPVEGEIDLQDEDILTNSFTATLTTRPWSRLEGVLTFNHFVRDAGETASSAEQGLARQDIDALTMTATANYLFSEDTSAGVGFRWRQRESESSGVQVDTDGVSTTTTFYDLFATWSQRLDPATTFSVQVGPSLGRDERDEPPTTVREFPRVAGPDGQPLLLSGAGCQRVDVGGVSRPFLSLGCRQVVYPLFDDGGQAIAAAVQPSIPDSLQGSLDARRVDLDLLPGEEVGSDGSNVNLFASMSLQRSWDRWNLVLRYTRSDSQVQSLGSSTVLDSLRADLRWVPSPRWNAVLTFGFTRRSSELESGTPVAVLGEPEEIPELGMFQPPSVLIDGETLVPQDPRPFVGAPIIGLASLDTEREVIQDLYDVNFRVTRDLTRKLQAFGEARYRRQERGGDLAADPFDRYEVRFGFRYQFRPIRL